LSVFAGFALARGDHGQKPQAKSLSFGATEAKPDPRPLGEGASKEVWLTEAEG